ncbi:L-rhamnose mutarotase [Enterococcus columbae]|nr:L-rhamnose mutarotase [Enterococcus columbae]
MMKQAFKMHLYPNLVEEYKKRHDCLWPEMVELLKQHGVKSYSIFWDKETNDLFAYLEIENEALWNKVALTEINQKWWRYMQDIMETNEDCSPVSIPLRPVFDLNK